MRPADTLAHFTAPDHEGARVVQPRTVTAYHVHDARVTAEFARDDDRGVCWLDIPHNAEASARTVAFFRTPEAVEDLIDALIDCARQWRETRG